MTNRHLPPARGFTFIEMLVVMIVVGLLAGLAYVKVQSSKDKGLVATMTSDLHAIAQEQEAYYFQNRTYTSDLVALNATLSQNNGIVINEATVSGWSGTMSNPRTAQRCYIFVGTAQPVGSATSDGLINCS